MLGGLDYHTIAAAVKRALAGVGVVVSGIDSTSRINEAQGADIPSAANIDLDGATGNLVDVTGVVAITSITLSQGRSRTVRFTGALTLTNGASLVLPGGVNIVTAAGDFAIFRGYAAGVVRCVGFSKASGAGLTPSITASLGADVALNNIANFFDGPSVAQGIVGTWFASGTVSLSGVANDQIDVKLWDGTTVIAAARIEIGPNGTACASVSGFITSPAGNIRISAKDKTNITGNIKFNLTGTSKDSTVTAIRLA